MAQQNLVVAQFAVTGATSFVASEANGVFVERGDASGPRMVERLVALPTGAIHDLDGTDDAKLMPGLFWNEFLFAGASPAAHTQYANLLGLVGRHGTLTGKVGNGSYTVAARLMPLKGTWETPYRMDTPNWLVIRAEWRLKGFWS